MSDKEKKSFTAKKFCLGFGLAVNIIGLVLIAVGIALLMTDSALEIKYGLAIAGIVVGFVGLIFVFAGLRKDKGEKAPEPVKCKYCGEPNPPQSKFCRKCGKPMVKKCVNCGAELDIDAQYCNTCGVRVRKDAY